MSKRKYSNTVINVDEAGYLSTKEVNQVTEGCTYFFNSQHIFLKLTTKERSYFDFICENMDWNNRIVLDKGIRTKYIKFYNKITSSKTCSSIRTLQRYENNLIECGLVMKYGNSICIVNPRYVYKGNLTSRNKLIKELLGLAQSNKIKLQPLLNFPKESIKADEKFVKFCKSNPINIEEL